MKALHGDDRPIPPNPKPNICANIFTVPDFHLRLEIEAVLPLDRCGPILGNTCRMQMPQRSCLARGDRRGLFELLLCLARARGDDRALCISASASKSCAGFHSGATFTASMRGPCAALPGGTTRGPAALSASIAAWGIVAWGSNWIVNAAGQCGRTGWHA